MMNDDQNTKEIAHFLSTVLRAPLPGFAQRDQALAVAPQHYPYCYYSPYRPLDSFLVRSLGIDEFVIEGTNRRWVYTTQLLSGPQLYDLELFPIDPASIVSVLLPHYERRYPRERYGDGIALTNPEYVQHDGRGILILPMQHDPHWKLIPFDRNGPVSSSQLKASRDAALLQAISLHCITPAPPTILKMIWIGDGHSTQQEA